MKDRSATVSGENHMHRLPGSKVMFLALVLPAFCLISLNLKAQPAVLFSSSQALINEKNVDAVIMDNSFVSTDQFRVRIDWLGQNSDAARVTWNVSDFTGFRPKDKLENFQRGKEDKYAKTAVQAQGDTIGIWLNSMDLGPNPAPNNGSLSISAGWWFQDKNLRPFIDENTGLEIDFDMQIPYDGTIGNAAAFVKINLFFQDIYDSNGLILGVPVYDRRTLIAEWASIHSDATGTTKITIADAGLNAKVGWFRKAPSSVDFQSATYSGFRRFQVGISPRDFQTLLHDVRRWNNCPTTGQLCPSGDFSRYRLTHFNLAVEIYDPDNASHGQLGISFKNLRVRQAPFE